MILHEKEYECDASMNESQKARIEAYTDIVIALNGTHKHRHMHTHTRANSDNIKYKNIYLDLLW